jgi:hypothetical protein
VLLVDDLDALGADWGDARERAGELQRAGARVTWRALAPAEGMPPEGGRDAAYVLPRAAASLARLRELAQARDFDLVVVASAAPGGGPLGAALGSGPRVRWWPTGLGGPSRSGRLAALGRGLMGRGRLLELDGAAASGSARRLNWSAADSRRAPARILPLWDGELALVPEGFRGRAGGQILAGFAAVAEQWSGLDLVAWTDAPAGGRAGALGIGMRVHHVGPPRRMAEWAWWAQASLAVLRGAGRLSAGLILRALAAGTPLLWVAPEPAARGCARWLEEQGCASVTGVDRRAVAAELARLLERGDEVERAIERGRALAAGHDVRALVERLAACLGVATWVQKRAAA